MEQKKKMFCIILTGPIIQKHNDFSEVTIFFYQTSSFSSVSNVFFLRLLTVKKLKNKNLIWNC